MPGSADEAECVVVTACDHAFARCAYQLLRSLARHARPGLAVVVFDLGLAPADAEMLRSASGDLPVSFRAFPFERYPAFVREHLAWYAWKPAALAGVVRAAECPVLWLDSASVVLRPLDRIFGAIARDGVYAPISGRGPLGLWTHPSAAAALGADARLLAVRNRAGGVCGFNGRAALARSLVEEWARLALDERYLAPPGADRSNHRYDQSLLTVLVNRLADEGKLRLTIDEVDVSSSHPIAEVSVRNKVAPSVPTWLDPLLWRCFAVRRFWNVLDVRVSRRLGF